MFCVFERDGEMRFKDVLLVVAEVGMWDRWLWFVQGLRSDDMAWLEKDTAEKKRWYDV